MPYADNNGIKIHYQVGGHGNPLMLVHGFGGSLSNWIESGSYSGRRPRLWR